MPTENWVPSASSTKRAPEPTLVPARAGLMLQNAGLGVVKRLHLEQRRRAAGLVLRARLAEHQPFAAERLDAGQFLAQVIDAAALLVGVQLHVLGLHRRQGVAHERQSLLERRFHRRSIEHQIRDLPPVLALVLPADDADRPLKRLAGQPQFAVERRLRQRLDEPVRGVIEVALPRDELLAVPVGPHAVELLAHPPAGQVGVVRPGLGQKQRRAARLLVALRAFLRGLGLLRQRAADPLLLRFVAAELAEVLAGPPLDGDRLVPPRRAGAGIDAARVLQDVRLRGGALHFGRFAVGKIGHGIAPDLTKSAAERS